MQVRLLGGVAAVDDRGDPIDLGPAKCRAVLAALALSVGDALTCTSAGQRAAWATCGPGES